MDSGLTFHGIRVTVRVRVACPLVGRFVPWLVVLSPRWSFCLLVGSFVPWLVVLFPGWSFCPLVGRFVPWSVVLSLGL